MLCQADSIARYYQKDPVFSDVSFQIVAGDRIGLVGPNGAGKTTLMNLLAGNAKPDYGSLRIAPEASVRLLLQIPRFPEGATLRAEARRALEHLENAYHEMLAVAENLAAAKDDAERTLSSDRYDKLQEFLIRHGGYEFDHRLEEVLFGLGFGLEDFDRALESFSGGQRSRVMLAQLLLAAPDIMLLDEPTNHLDVDATEWLEAYLRRQSSAIVVVSHDRYFLDRSVERIFEIQSGRLTVYPGDYSGYAKLRAERQLVADRIATKQHEQIAHYEDFVRRNKFGQLAKQAKSREKMIARIEDELVETIQNVVGPRMTFIGSGAAGNATGGVGTVGKPNAVDRSGDIVLDASNVGMEFPGKRLFAGFSYVMQRGERIGFVGPNGAGKTTLLRILLGQLKPTQGLVRVGHNVKIGYLDQNLELLEMDSTPLAVVRPPWRIQDKPEPFRALLARFGIGADLVEKSIKTLSGGERTRVALAKLCAYEVNLLALDEPTNHLDPWAAESLEAALREFPGGVMVVSHDRTFLNNTVDRLIYVAHGEAKLVMGGYEALVAYRSALQQRLAPAESADAKSIVKSKAQPQAAKPSRKYAYRKSAEIEAEIAKLEAVTAALESSLLEPEVYKDGRKVKQVSGQIVELKAKLSDLYEHWNQAIELNW